MKQVTNGATCVDGLNTLTGYFNKYTLLMPGWTPFFIQNWFKSSWQGAGNISQRYQCILYDSVLGSHKEKNVSVHFENKVEIIFWEKSQNAAIKAVVWSQRTATAATPSTIMPFVDMLLTLHFTLSLSDMKTVSLLAHKHNVVINVETMVQKATSSQKEKLGDKVVSQIHLREAFCNAYISPSSCFT